MNFRRIMAMALAVMMLLLCGCQPPAGTTGGGEPTGNANYKVTVLGADGKPCTDSVYVRILKGGEQVIMQKLGGDGTLTKELERGDYTVELRFSDSDAAYTYDTENLTLSATKTELTIQLYNSMSEDSRVIIATVNDVSKEYNAHTVTAGMSIVSLDQGDRTFFIFEATQTGYYEVSFTGDIEHIDYYATPDYVLKVGAASWVEDKEKTFSLNITKGNLSGTGVARLVIGVDTKSGTDEGVLNIIRVGEFVPDMPYTPYVTTAALTPWVLPEGDAAKLTDFDLKASYDIVYNETDGFYHVGSADGPLVLVYMGKQNDERSKYLDSFETVSESESFVRYYYEEKDGERVLVKKVNFSQCMLDHLAVMDEASGLYPLTEDLKHIITERGEYKGWWEMSSPNYLFKNEQGMNFAVNPETAWLFNCCYVPAE